MEMEWRNSDKDPPEEGDLVIVTLKTEEPKISFATYLFGMFDLGFGCGCMVDNVWWMPAPKPYARGKHEKH